MKGFEAIKQASEKIESVTSDFPNVLWFRLQDDGDNGVVRFLEQGDEVYSYWYHDFSTLDEANGWRTAIPCLDQDDKGDSCPGCDAGLSRRFKGLVNVIWRNAPVFERDQDGKVVKDSVTKEYKIEGYQDQVAVWRGGIQLFSKTLARKDVKYKGLTTRDFEVTREGRRGDSKTTYSVEPNDIDEKPGSLNDKDQALANDKHDLSEVAGFVTADVFQKIIDKRTSESNGNGEADISEFLSETPFEKKD